MKSVILGIGFVVMGLVLILVYGSVPMVSYFGIAMIVGGLIGVVGQLIEL